MHKNVAVLHLYLQWNKLRTAFSTSTYRNVENFLAVELHTEADVGASSRLHFENRPLCFWVDWWPNCTQKVVIECLEPVGDYSLFFPQKVNTDSFSCSPKSPNKIISYFHSVRT